MRAFTFQDVGFMGLLGGAVAPGATAFSFTGYDAMQSWTVPAGITSVSAKLWGGAGGTVISGGNTFQGGYGAFVTGTFTVTPGQILAIKIGWGPGTGTVLGGGYTALEYPSGSPTVWMIAAGGGGAHSGVFGGDGGPSGFSGMSLDAINQGGRGATPFAGGNGGGVLSFGGSGGFLFGGTGDRIADASGVIQRFTAPGGGGGLYGGGGGCSFFADHRAGAAGGGSNLVSGVSAALSINTTGLVGFMDPNWNGVAGSGSQGYVYLNYQ